MLGSLAGWGVLWLFPSKGALALGFTVALVFVAVVVSHWAEKYLETHDDPRIIIDEVAGVWIAGWAMPREWEFMLGALFLFRVFDVWKGPWGQRVSRWPGGWGIVADDVLAGILANAILQGIMLKYSLL